MHLNDKNTLCDFYRYRGIPQGSVQARTLTRCSRKSPSVMGFWHIHAKTPRGTMATE